MEPQISAKPVNHSGLNHLLILCQIHQLNCFNPYMNVTGISQGIVIALSEGESQ